ncbi:MAG: hypothetical protein N2379_10440, partial [Verrucomicrobiae bacterium]|nr:hypothetical protein [Verrucomicrobiae bacterium]
HMAPPTPATVTAVTALAKLWCLRPTQFRCAPTGRGYKLGRTIPGVAFLKTRSQTVPARGYFALV